MTITIPAAQVLNDAVHAGAEQLQSASEAIAAALTRGLGDVPEYAEFEIRVTGRVIDPRTRVSIGMAEVRDEFCVYPERRDHRS